MDLARARRDGNAGDALGSWQDIAHLYVTEMEQGASDEHLYAHNREVACVVCSAPFPPAPPAPPSAPPPSPSPPAPPAPPPVHPLPLSPSPPTPPHPPTPPSPPPPPPAPPPPPPPCPLPPPPPCTTPECHHGAVYTQWGSRTCGANANPLYDGFVAAGYYTYRGGGANHICMHPSPEAPDGATDGSENGNLVYGTEYESTGVHDVNTNGDAACVVCQRPSAVQTYVQWGRRTCTSGHRTEYTGYVMSENSGHSKRTSLCVDPSRAVHSASQTTNNDGALLVSLSESYPGPAWLLPFPHAVYELAARYPKVWRSISRCAVPYRNGGQSPRL